MRMLNLSPSIMDVLQLANKNVLNVLPNFIVPCSQYEGGRNCDTSSSVLVVSGSAPRWQQ